ncbi:MAG: hypothetical protein ACI837_002326 [Crocinitomicaceae bacterium]|jgi:hypothetical protein
MTKILIIVLLWSFNSFAQQDCGETPELNKRIAALAKGKLKKKVGRGECWDLAQYVLDETGAEWDQYEVYGRLIDPEEECIFPGDIIQFEKIKIKYIDGNETFTESMYHHTAIVYKVIDDNEVTVLHQNTADHGRKVGQSPLRFNSITSGKLFIYRPME